MYATAGAQPWRPGLRAGRKGTERADKREHCNGVVGLLVTGKALATPTGTKVACHGAARLGHQSAWGFVGSWSRRWRRCAS